MRHSIIARRTAWLMPLLWLSSLAATAQQGADLGVRVMEQGAEPRRALRYDPLPEANETMAARITSATFMVDGEREFPTAEEPDVKLTMTVTAKEPELGRTLVLEYMIVEAELTPRPGAQRMLIAIMREQLQAMKTLGFRLRGDARGLSMEITTQHNEETGPLLTERLRREAERLRLGVIPLPEEPVGVGAVWQLQSRVRDEGVMYEEIAEYTLRAFDGDQLLIDLSIVRVADRQTLETGLQLDADADVEIPPALRQAMRPRLLRAEVMGEGKAKVDLRQPARNELRLSLSHSRTMEVVTEGGRLTTTYREKRRMTVLPTAEDEREWAPQTPPPPTEMPRSRG